MSARLEVVTYSVVRNGGTKEPLYLKLALRLQDQIRKGALRPGDRVPSIRSLRRQQGVSTSTVLQAYFWLEDRGWIEARPRSGFYVRVPYVDLIPESEVPTDPAAEQETEATHLAKSIMESLHDRGYIPLGAASISSTLYPNRRLNKIIHYIIRRDLAHSAHYETPGGVEVLRQQIARQATSYGCSLIPDDLIITSGGTEALNLALRAVAGQGDAIAVESPTYFVVLQIIESLGMKAIEIPTHPRNGMDLDALSVAIDRRSVKACLSMTNCQNPLGFILDDNYKRDLVTLLSKHKVALIEDDTWGDLAFRNVRPTSAKAFDTEGTVLSCSSFSKVLGPGFRVGWVEAGRFREAVKWQKFITTVAAPSLPQRAIAEFIQSGGYDRYIRGLRETLENQLQVYSEAIAQYFPKGTNVSQPGGGYLLWLELPATVDATTLYRAAASQKISILPGVIFSPTARFSNHIQISCGHPWSNAIDQALITLGKLAEKLSVPRRATITKLQPDIRSAGKSQ